MQRDKSPKVNLYYYVTFGRYSRIKQSTLSFIFFISSWPRLILEVFLRKSMGERYFNFGSVILITILLALVPYFLSSGMPLFFIITNHFSWYAFLGLFLFFGFKRWKEIKRGPSVYDFGKFSLSSGHWHSFFSNITFLGKRSNPRTISIIYEPAIFVLAGLVLTLLAQMIGPVLIFSGLLYSISYLAAFNAGDEFVMDQIDKMISNEEMYDSFVQQKPPEETRGFTFYGRGPAGEDQRENLVNSFFADQEESSAIAH